LYTTEEGGSEVREWCRVEDKTDREEDGRTGREREEEQIEGEEGGREDREDS
jgi:hypothetical protein